MRTILCFLLSAFCFCGQAAVYFDAVDDVLATTTNASFGQVPITVSAWVKPEGFGEGSAGARSGPIIERVGLSPTRGWLFFYSSQNTGNGTNTFGFYAQFATAGLNKSATANICSSNQWQHLAATWDGTTSTNGISLYRNGILTGVFALTEGSGAYIPTTNTTFTIGNRHTTTITFGGQLSEIAVWTNALTASDIATLATPRIARLPLHVRPSALVGYWPMDGGPDGLAVSPVNCIVDLSGQGNHASPTNSPAWRSSALSYP